MLGAVPKEEVGSAPLTGVHICFHSSSSETHILNAISPFAFFFFFTEEVKILFGFLLASENRY